MKTVICFLQVKTKTKISSFCMIDTSTDCIWFSLYLYDDEKKKFQVFFFFTSRGFQSFLKNCYSPLGIRVRDKSTLRTWVWTAMIHFCGPKNKVPSWAMHLRAGLRDSCGSLPTQNILWYGNYIPFHHSSQTKGKHSHLPLTFPMCFLSLNVYLAWEGVHF